MIARAVQTQRIGSRAAEDLVFPTPRALTVSNRGPAQLGEVVTGFAQTGVKSVFFFAIGLKPLGQRQVRVHPLLGPGTGPYNGCPRQIAFTLSHVIIFSELLRDRYAPPSLNTANRP